MSQNSSFGGGFLSQATSIEKKQNVRGHVAQAGPITAKMFHEMLPGEENLRIGSHEFQRVTIVGIVKQVSREGGVTFYQIDDSTDALVPVRHYLESNEDHVPVEVNTYARVIGVIKMLDNKRIIVCHFIGNLSNVDEISSHLLEVVTCRLLYTKDILNNRGEKSIAGLPTTSLEPTAACYNVASKWSSNSAGVTLNEWSGGASSSSSNATNGDLEQSVYKYLKNIKSSEEGVSFKQIASRFSKWPPEEIRSCLENLAGEGNIYTTHDEDHYKVTS